MKSIHLAKADFLRELAKYAKELYEFGDFTCTDEKRVNLSSKIDGFAGAGLIIGLVTRAEIQGSSIELISRGLGKSVKQGEQGFLREQSDKRVG